MKVTWKIKMTNGDICYRVNGTTDWCYDPKQPKTEPVRAISQEMYDGKKDLIPGCGLFDMVIKRVAISTSEIINIEQD